MRKNTDVKLGGVAVASARSSSYTGSLGAELKPLKD